MICQNSQTYRVKHSLVIPVSWLLRSIQGRGNLKPSMEYDDKTPPKPSELVMLSTTTSISTRSPTASSKKTLKVVGHVLT